MLRTIFVPLEISSSDDTVIKYALELAKNLHSRLIFFKTYLIAEFAYPTSGMASIAPTGQILVDDEKELRKEKIDYLINNFPELNNMDFELIINPGTAVDLLPDAAKECHADLVIIGTSGASGIEELFGTMAEKMTREASCPVMVIPDHFKFQPIRKIGIALDEENVENELQLDTLFSMAKELSATLDIVNVSENIIDADIHHNKIYKRLKREFNDNVNYFTIRILLKDDEEKALSDYIVRNQIDMLTLIYREHGFFKRIFNPGLRKRMVFHADKPLLVLK